MVADFERLERNAALASEVVVHRQAAVIASGQEVRIEAYAVFGRDVEIHVQRAAVRTDVAGAPAVDRKLGRGVHHDPEVRVALELVEVRDRRLRAVEEAPADVPSLDLRAGDGGPCRRVGHVVAVERSRIESAAGIGDVRRPCGIPVGGRRPVHALRAREEVSERHRFAGDRVRVRLRKQDVAAHARVRRDLRQHAADILPVFDRPFASQSCGLVADGRDVGSDYEPERAPGGNADRALLSGSHDDDAAIADYAPVESCDRRVREVDVRVDRKRLRAGRVAARKRDVLEHAAVDRERRAARDRCLVRDRSARAGGDRDAPVRSAVQRDGAVPADGGGHACIARCYKPAARDVTRKHNGIWRADGDRGISIYRKHTAKVI